MSGPTDDMPLRQESFRSFFQSSRLQRDNSIVNRRARHSKDPHPREVLQKNQLRATSRRGQNFLVSTSTLDRIVDLADVRDTETVLEVGAGLGRLTRRLAKKAARVVAVEVDSGLYEVARGRLQSLANLQLLHCDFLESKHRINPQVTDAVQTAREETGGKVKVVSNLPYSIASPTMVCLLEWELPVGGVFVLLQSDVAERLTAEPGCGDYSPLTVTVRYHARVQKAFDLPPHAFWPQPKVASTFVKIVPRPAPRPAESYEAFQTAVRKLFQFRRKTLGKALKIWLGRKEARPLLERTRLDPSMRVEALAVDDFVTIANALD